MMIVVRGTGDDAVLEPHIRAGDSSETGIIPMIKKTPSLTALMIGRNKPPTKYLE
jgi:hypothetical protein